MHNAEGQAMLQTELGSMACHGSGAHLRCSCPPGCHDMMPNEQDIGGTVGDQEHEEVHNHVGS